MKNDSAARGISEVLHAYPDFFAIAIYRISHMFWIDNIKILPRMFAEYAHSKTSIGIHFGTIIGKVLFFDHGTDVVIGETAVIGNQIKIYQKATIEAFDSLNNREKRHATIEDNVSLYSGAFVLGGCIYW